MTFIIHTEFDCTFKKIIFLNVQSDITYELSDITYVRNIKYWVNVYFNPLSLNVDKFEGTFLMLFNARKINPLSTCKHAWQKINFAKNLENESVDIVFIVYNIILFVSFIICSANYNRRFLNITILMEIIYH